MAFIIGGAKIEKETIKLNKVEKDFVTEVVRTGDKFVAGENLGLARNEVKELLSHENVNQAIVATLDSAGLTDAALANKMNQIISTAQLNPRYIKADEVLRAIEMVYNLKGSFAAKKIDINTKNSNVTMLMQMNETELQKMLLELTRDGAGNAFPQAPTDRGD